MDWKKGDRVQANYKGDLVHGVVTSSTASKTAVTLDDTVTNLVGSPLAFRPSDKPMPKALKEVLFAKRYVGERVEIMHKGKKRYGVIASVGSKNAKMHLDDGVSTLTAPHHAFKASSKPLPEGVHGNMNAKLKKGDRVEFTDRDGTVKTGVVQRGGANVSVMLDGGKISVRGSASVFRLSDKPLPTDVPHPMDDWGIVGYKEAGGEETIRFEATITYKGKKVIHSANGGFGGPNQYSPLRGVDRSILQTFFAAAKQWAADHGAEDPIEPEDSWVTWKTNEAPYGVTAQQHWDEYNSFFERHSHLSNKAPKP